jgi:hypothetical protein
MLDSVSYTSFTLLLQSMYFGKCHIKYQIKYRIKTEYLIENALL